jgi:hypothetical protein
VLEISNGIENLGGLNLPLAFALLISWLVVFAALSKGVQSLGEFSKINLVLYEAYSANCCHFIVKSRQGFLFHSDLSVHNAYSSGNQRSDA